MVELKNCSKCNLKRKQQSFKYCSWKLRKFKKIVSICYLSNYLCLFFRLSINTTSATMMKPLDAVPIFLAELIGTGMLLCMGCGGVLNWGSPASHLQIVLNFGLVIMIIIQVFGAVSGAHLNPAITLAALIFKKISAPMALVYMTAQFLGSFMGFGLLKALTPPDVFGPPDAAVGHCMLVVHPDVSIMQALIIEFMATSVLVLILCSLFDPRNSHAHDSVSLRFGLAICALAFSFVSIWYYLFGIYI